MLQILRITKIYYIYNCMATRWTHQMQSDNLLVPQSFHNHSTIQSRDSLILSAYYECLLHL